MPEQISDLGYLGLIKEASKGTPLTPNKYLPIFSETLAEDMAIQDINPIMGLKAKRYDTLKGQRNFKGAIEFLGEPNIAGYVMDMILNKASTSGAGPYTHTFNLNTTNPNSYTVDIARGRMVFRFYGLEASEVGVQFEDNRVKLVTQVSALGSFGPREISSVSTNVLTLKSDYDPKPAKGVVTGDLVRIFLAGGTVVDTTVSAVTDTTITVASAGAAAAGDFIALRPASPSFTLVDYLQFAKSEFRFGATAAAALSATHTPVEQGSVWKVMHEFLPENGQLRSGAYDPVSLVRGLGDAELNTKIFFDTPDEKNRFFSQALRAAVVRMFAGATNQYELRLTLNALVQSQNNVNLKVGEVLYNDIAWKPEYNTSDNQMFNVVVVNNVSTI